jgi:hypothetical protein
MKKMVFLLILLCSLCTLLAIIPLAFGHKAHKHGAAKMNMAVDGARVSMDLECPLADILPFEHSPVTIEQQEQVKAMAGRMRQAETLFQLTPAAECRLEKVTLASDKLDPALLDPQAAVSEAPAGDGQEQNEEAAEEEHGDLDAEFIFMCLSPANLNSVDVLLFSAWPDLKTIEVQAITPKGQRAAKLTPKKNRISW